MDISEPIIFEGKFQKMGKAIGVSAIDKLVFDLGPTKVAVTCMMFKVPEGWWKSNSSFEEFLNQRKIKSSLTPLKTDN